MNSDPETNKSDAVKVRIVESNDQEGDDNSSESGKSGTIFCSHCGSEATITTNHCPNCGVNLHLSSEGQKSSGGVNDTDVMGRITDDIATSLKKLSELLSGMANVTLFLVALGTAIVGACFPPLWLLTIVLVLLLIVVTD